MTDVDEEFREASSLARRAAAAREWGVDPQGWPSWECGACEQRNSGWTLTCGRCEAWRPIPGYWPDVTRALDRAVAEHPRPNTISVASIQRVHLEPGDMLALTLPERAPASQIEQMAETLKGAFGEGGPRVLVLQPGMELTRVTQEAIAAPATHTWLRSVARFALGALLAVLLYVLLSLVWAAIG